MQNKNNLAGFDFKKAMPILVLVALGAFALFIVTRGGSDDSNTAADEQREEQQTENQDQAVDSGIDINDVVVAEDVDRDNCAVNTTSSLSSDTSTFYVVAENSTVPANTEVFVRLYRDGQPIDDSDPITSIDAYEDTCINFVFESTSTFVEGNYEAEFIVNGNPLESVQFEIQ